MFKTNWKLLKLSDAKKCHVTVAKSQCKQIISNHFMHYGEYCAQVHKQTNTHTHTHKYANTAANKPHNTEN